MNANLYTARLAANENIQVSVVGSTPLLCPLVKSCCSALTVFDQIRDMGWRLRKRFHHQRQPVLLPQLP
jgi:hypothetical protein